MRNIFVLLALWAGGCTVYTYDGPPPSYVAPVYYQPAPMVVRAPVRYWGWSRTYTVVPGRHRHQPCESRGRRAR